MLSSTLYYYVLPCLLFSELQRFLCQSFCVDLVKLIHDALYCSQGPCGFYVHPSGFEKPLHDCVDALRQCYGDKQGKHYRVWVDQVFSTQVSSDIWIVRFKKWEISGKRPFLIFPMACHFDQY